MDKPILDLAGVMERVDNDVELFVSLMDILKGDAPNKLESLHKAVQNGDTQTAKEVAHSLKSALGNLGAARAHEVARQLEFASREGKKDQIGDLVKLLEVAIGEFYTEFDRVKGTL